MPLVMLCGQPCSGKSTVAARLAALFEKEGHAPVVVDEELVMLDKNRAYKDATNEKNARASFKAGVDRKLSRKTVVILDSINNIKGFRYEIWCIARTAATRSCVLHCDVPVEQCRAWNLQRAACDAYEAAVFDDLAGRFERPDTRSRWDSPLFETRADDPQLDAMLQKVVSAMLGSGESRVAQPVRDLTPTHATTPPSSKATNLLADIDRAAQNVIGAIVAAQTESGGAAGFVSLGADVDPLLLSEPVSLPELRRHKRTFMKLATQNEFAQIKNYESAMRSFGVFLQDKLAQS